MELYKCCLLPAVFMQIYALRHDSLGRVMFSKFLLPSRYERVSRRVKEREHGRSLLGLALTCLKYLQMARNWLKLFEAMLQAVPGSFKRSQGSDKYEWTSEVIVEWVVYSMVMGPSLAEWL